MANPIPLADDVAAMAFVHSALLCRVLAPAQLHRLVQAGDVRQWPGQSLVLQEGEQASGLYLLHDGKALLCKSLPNAPPVEVVPLERGAVFGETAVLTQGTEPGSVVSVTELQCICFAAPMVRMLANEEHRFGRRLAALMAARAKEIHKRAHHEAS